MSGCFPGISQSRISHWLLQHGSDLSEQKKRAFYRWYTLEKTTPGTSGFINCHNMFWRFALIRQLRARDRGGVTLQFVCRSVEAKRLSPLRIRSASHTL